MRDFSSIVRDKGIPWVRHWIQASHEWSKNFIDENGVVDFESLGREEFEFREALYNKDFSTNERAKYLWNEALKMHDRQAANGKKGGRPKKSPQDAPNGNAGEDLSTTGNRGALEPPTSCDLNSVRPSPAGGVTASTGLPAASEEAGKITADGDTREDSQDMHHAREGGTSESATSANLYALDGLAGKDRQPRAPGAHAKPRGARSPEIPDQEDLYEQVAAEGLDEFDARQWYDMCSDRRWLDRDGNPIANWKGALKRFCDAKARRRGKEKG
jgi:hypothetical protein